MAVSPEENKKVVASFVEVCQNQHDLSFADEIFHPDFVNHYKPGGRAIEETPGRPAERLPAVLRNAAAGRSRRDDAGRRAARRAGPGRDAQDLPGTHTGELWGLPPSGNRVEWEFIDIMRVRDGKIVEHWTSMDLEALRAQMQPLA